MNVLHQLRAGKAVKSQWRKLFGLGTVAHPSGDFEVTPDFVDGLIRTFNYFKSRYGYLPPLVWDHPTITADMTEDTAKLVREQRALHPGGIPYGLIDQLRRTPDGGVEIHVRLTELGQYWWDSICHISPAVWLTYVDVHTRETMGPVLREVSAVTVPHLKNISSGIRLLEAAITMSEAGFPPKEKKMEMEAILEAIRAELAPITERLDALESRASAEPETEEPVESAEDEPTTAMSDTQRELASLRREMNIARAEAAVTRELAEIATGNDQLVRTLAEVRVSQGEKAYKVVAASVIKAAASAEQPPIGMSGSTVDVPSHGNFRKMSDDQFVRACTEHIARGVRPDQLNRMLEDVDRLKPEEILEKKTRHRQAINTLYRVHGGK